MSPADRARARLVADDAVTTIVGQKVYPVEAPPEAQAPFVVCAVASNVPEETFESLPATGVSTARVQVDCYAATYPAARALLEAVEDALCAPLVGQPPFTKLVDRDLRERETMLYRASADFQVSTRRSNL